MAAPLGDEPDHLLTPNAPNHVWHLDFTTLRILWFHFTLAAVVDGFSRKLLCLRLYGRTPCSLDMIRLIRAAIAEYGNPRFIITDHGTQFRHRFHQAIIHWGIHHVRGRVRAPYPNGKIERLFRTFRIWWRFVLTGLSVSGMQRKLDDYRHWYNHHRPHSALDGLTPDEAWRDESLPQAFSFRDCDTAKARITVRRLPCRGDPRLPIMQIQVRRAA